MPSIPSLGLLREALRDFREDEATRLAAALAYYTLFALAPLLVVVIAVAGLALGREAVQGRVVEALSGLVGEQGAQGIEGLIAGASRERKGGIAALLGIVTLVVGAGGVFGHLRRALDTIWEIELAPRRGWLGALKHRFLSFAMVLGTGFLLLVSLVVTAALAALGERLSAFVPGHEIVWQGVNAVFSLGVTVLVFALIFRFVPDVEIRWRHVWFGAVTTALLFTVGKFALGLYLGRSAFSSTYGAAASLVIVLMWVYYSSLILFFGAELTQVWARRAGSPIASRKGARARSAARRAEPETGSTRQRSAFEG